MVLQLFFISSQNFIFEAGTLLQCLILIKVEVSFCLVLQLSQSSLNIVSKFDNHSFHVFPLGTNVVMD